MVGGSTAKGTNWPTDLQSNGVIMNRNDRNPYYGVGDEPNHWRIERLAIVLYRIGIIDYYETHYLIDNSFSPGSIEYEDFDART